ncbi:hypothetical protein M419DRAFT_7436 [Trichoderma reesei RUT C-30]|uniref:Uncharacterized protein n=1 Tax=Hypocrea jecorina (strain ATCC 56765 / BCRC 32924 / NRRL 11460 / Rut C-30) TaxID=1344414 RepID=A0A024SH47_HYPJR|nr:hypothetical protein M419DRAFT_7436 [Trichoderma reesei RUT C-30]
MAPLQDAEASSHPGLDREPLLPARVSPLAPGNALSGPIIANSASGARHDAARGPTAMRATSRGPTIVVSDPRAVAAAAALREAHSRPEAMAPPPSGPRAERAAEAPQATPRMQHVAPILQHHGPAQPPPGFFQEYRGSSQAPLNAPRGPRADYRPPAAQSNAPPNAPRGPRADYWPSQPPRNAPQAPRGQPWQYHTHQDGSQAHRSQNWQYQQRRNVVPGNISTSQTTQNAFNALPTASRASQAMQPFPPAPQWSPQMPESFAGATHPTTYPYSLYTSPPCPALYGPYAFNRPSTYQYMEELPYYQVLQDYNQWHASGPSGGGPWNATPPDTDEVVRHGMILRFLDSLPPPPSNPEFPPDPPQLYLKTRRRRGNQSRSSRESGDTGQTESTEGTTTITRPVMPTASVDVLPPPVAHRTPYRRGRRGTSGRRRQADDNNRDGSGQGSEQSDKPGASGQAVDVADAAKVIESADVGDIDETHENGQDDGEGEECDGQEDDVDDDCASAASCMW